MGLFDSLIKKQVERQLTAQMADIYQRNLFAFLNSGQPVYLTDNFHTFVEEGYSNIGAVYECVDLLLNKITACPVIIYQVTDNAKYEKYLGYTKSGALHLQAKALQLKAQSLTEVSPKRIQDMLDKPNALQNRRDFIRSLAGYRLLVGNAYIYLNGPNPKKRQWKEMFSLPAQSVQIISGGVFEPVKGYRLDVTTDTSIDFKAEQVVHIKAWNPNFSTTGAQLYGMPPLRPLVRKLSRSREGEKEINKQLRNGGAFGLLSPKNAADTLLPDQKLSLKERLLDAKNAGDALARIFPASIAMEWQQIGLNFADMGLLELLKATDEDIYRAFHIPLQFRSTDSSTFNNQSVAGKQLIYNAVAPICDEIGEALTEAIGDIGDGKRYVIKLDYTALPELSEDMEQVAKWLKDAWWLDGNEKREVMGWGKKEGVENMDTPLVPGNLVRVDMVHLNEAGFTQGVEQETNKQ